MPAHANRGKDIQTNGPPWRLCAVPCALAPAARPRRASPLTPSGAKEIPRPPQVSDFIFPTPLSLCYLWDRDEDCVAEVFFSICFISFMNLS